MNCLQTGKCKIKVQLACIFKKTQEHQMIINYCPLSGHFCPFFMHNSSSRSESAILKVYDNKTFAESPN